MSANSDLIKNWFIQSLTARAAYAYFSGIPATNSPIRATGEREMNISSVMDALNSTQQGQQAKFSEELATYFVAHFATIDHKPNTDTGYSATLFALRLQPLSISGGELQTTPLSPDQTAYTDYVFAQRGTEPGSFDDVVQDLVKADGGIAFVGQPVKQREDMNVYWAQLTGNASGSPIGDIYDVMDDLRENGATVTGHSLGGALAEWFYIDHPGGNDFVNGFTFNGAGVATRAQRGPSAIAAWVRENIFRASPSFPSNRFQNVFGQEGAEVTAGANTMLGPIYPVTIEDTPNDIFGTGVHSMANLSDSLACYYLLSQLDEDISLDSLRSILRSFTASKPDVREEFARWLQGVFETSGPVGVEGQTVIFDRINILESQQRAGTAPTFSIAALSTKSADQIFELANGTGESAAAVRYALVHGAPLAITGTTINWSTRDGGALARENFTEEYLRERSVYLSHLNAAQAEDLVYPSNGALYSMLGNSYYAEDVDETTVTRRVASTMSAVDEGIARDISVHLFGGLDGDTLVGGSKDDYLFGGAGVDDLQGGNGNDTLEGGDDADVLSGGAGVNTLIGGSGFDTYKIALGSGTTRIRDSDGLGLVQIQDESGWHSLGVEIEGMNGASRMAIDSRSNTYRLSGNVSAWGGGGNLTITTRDGRSIIIENYFAETGGGGTNGGSLQSLRGAGGLAGESTNDGPGDSTPFLGIEMPPEPERPPFPTTADFVFAPTTLTGGPGWFVLNPLSAQAFMSEHYDENTNVHSELLDLTSLVSPSRPHHYVYGSFGDTFVRGKAGESNLIIDDYYQPQGIHVIGETVGNDILEGGAVTDYLLTHGGDDKVYGGGGSDILIDRPEDWTEFGTVAWVNAPGHTNRDQLFGEAGNDLISANAGDGFLSGGDGGDLLLGGAHSDTLIGGNGSDFLSGDTKNTSYLLDYTPESVHLNIQNLAGELEHFGADVLDGGDGDDVLIGGGGADTLYGGNDNDILMGDLVILNPQGTWTWESAPAGNVGTYSYATVLAQHEFDPDTIHGADVLYGEDGNDFLFGGGLSDELHGGAGDDVVYGENQGSGTATEAAIALAFHGADRIFGDAGNDFLYGNGGDDFIDGGDGNDVLVGDSNTNGSETGNDELHGGSGVDLILGNSGDDRIFGDAGNDDLQGGAGMDLIAGGDGDDNIHGDSGDDTLEGGAGVDAIAGDDGNDTLMSGAGGDSLYGGAGNDTFLLRVGSGATYVSDDSGSTVIRFDGAIRREDVRVEAATFNGGQSVRIFYSATDYAFLTTADFDRVTRFDFSDGMTLNKEELLLAYQPPAANLGDGKIHLNVDSALVTLHGAGSDLLLHYTGANSGWANTADLTGKGVLWSKSQAAAFGLGSGEVLVLKNWYTTDIGSSVSTIQGQFGETVDLAIAALNLARTQQATDATPYAVGNGGNDTLLGSATSDTLIGGAGDDTLEGSFGSDILGGEEGNDTYVLRPGSGFDIISEDQGSDILRFKDGILSTDVAFHELNGGLEIIIGDPSNGNRTVIAGWFDGAEKKIEQFIFEGDGVTWSSSNVEALITGNRRPVLADSLSDSLLVSETPFSFSIPATAFVDPNVGDTLSLSVAGGSGFGALPDWLSFNPATRTFGGTAPTGSGSVEISVYATDGDGLTASDKFTVSFAPALITGTSGNDDGSSAPILTGGGIGERIEGLAGNDILNGNGGNDILVGGQGSDILVGGSGDDVYLFNAGDGADTIYPNGATTADVDVITFGSGIQPGDVTFARLLTNGLRIHIGGMSSSNYIDIYDYFDPANINLRVSQVTFVDSPGTTISSSQIDSLVLVPTEQSDYLRGTAAPDSISGLGGDDTIFGLEGDDTLDGGNGSDSLDGGLGNDILIGGGGADTLTGGAGSDTYVLTRSSTASSIQSTGSLSADVDLLRLGTGIASSDVRVERSQDSLVLRINAATPYGAETAIVLAGDGANAAAGQSVDELRFQDEPGTVWTAADLRARSLQGGLANETLTGFDSDDVLRGGGGNDSLNGGLGADTYQFGLGQSNDIVRDTSGANRIVLDSGITPANVSLVRSSSLGLTEQAAGGDALVIQLNGGTDQLWIESFYSTGQPTLISQLVFGNGVIWDDATIRANASSLAGTANSMSGTGANDNYSVDHPDDTIAEVANAGTDLATSSVGFALPTNVENLTLTGSLNIYGRGNSLANVVVGNVGINYLYGQAGNDSLSGGAGNDRLDGGTDDDTLTGGSGDDYYTVETQSLGTTWSTAGLQNIRDVVVEAANEGADTIYADRVYSLTMANNVENLIVYRIAAYSVSFNTTDDVRRKFIGNALDNVIDARQADNVGMGVGVTFTGNGAGGEIVLDGGSGADTMIGADLRTRFIVDNVNDVVIAGTNINDTVETSLAYTLGSNVENLTLTGTGSVAGTGNAANNLLDGSKNTASNVLTGGLGNDTYLLGVGDTVVELAGQGNDSVRLTSIIAGSTYSVSSYQNTENLSIAGVSGTATLIGDSADNSLTGNTSANTFNGGAGNDSLTGDAGGDFYDGFSLTSGNDVIIDTAGSDSIQFNPAANTPISQLDATRVGNDLVIAVGAQSSIRVQNWYSGTTNKIEGLYAYDQGLAFSYTGAELEASANGTNIGPRANGTDSTQAGIGQAFSYQMRANMFLDFDSQESLIYSATQSNGSALPSWLSFNAATRAFSGTPAAGEAGVSVTVSATDAGGLSTTTTLLIDVVVLPIIGTEGDDVISGTSGEDIIEGRGGNDTLTGLASSDSIYGEAGNDTLDGGLGDDYMEGGLGDDVMYVDSLSDDPWELPGEGNDEIRASITYSLPSDFERLTLTGSGNINGTGNTLANVITGNSGQNVLTGGSGNDTLDGGSAGNDTLNGGQGDDTFVVNRSGLTLQESSGQGIDTVSSSITFTLATNFENLTLTGTGDINGTGNTVANIIIGNSGNNRLNGGSGGTDTLTGGAGNDVYVDPSGDTINESVGGGVDTVESVATFSIASLAEVENLTLTNTSGTVTGTGNSGNNVLTGSAGNNTLVGGGGNDTFDPGTAGTDILQGQTGDDTYIWTRASGVTITEAAGEGTDTVQSSLTFTLATNFENLILTGSGNINGTGNTVNNVITGNAGNNTILGGSGHDTLDAGTAGTDSLQGQTGDDTYIWTRASGVTLTEAAGEGTDTVQSSLTFTLATNFENLTLTGSSNINGTGNSANNVITGNSGNNTIDGGSGDDTINGGGGADSITGGLGADIYRFTSGGGADTINNVAADSLTDRLQLTDLASNQVTFAHVGNNLVATVIGGGSITVSNWFSASANRIDFLNFTNGEYTANQVDAAANGGGTLGGFAPPAMLRSPAYSVAIRNLLERNGVRGRGIETVSPRRAIAVDARLDTPDQIETKSNFPNVRWEPIKSFLQDSSTTLGAKLAAEDSGALVGVGSMMGRDEYLEKGFSRLLDAIAIFDRDLVGTDSAIADTRHGDVLAQLAARHEVLNVRDPRGPVFLD